MSEQTKSYQFKYQILADLREGKLQPGQSLGSAKELSDRYGIPLITVNRLLVDMAREGLVTRIKGKGSFVSEEAGSHLSLHRHIGVCYPASHLEASPAIYSAFGLFTRHTKQVLESQGHHVFSFSLKDIRKEDFDRGLDLDGVLVSMSELNAQTIPILLKRSYPIVTTLQSHAESIPFHQVIPDLPNSFYRVACMMMDKGIEGIRILHNDDPTSVQRARIFRQSASWAGYSPESVEVVSVAKLPGDLGQLTGARLAEHELKSFVHGMAYFIPSDFIAIGFLSLMMERKLVPGEDFQLVSFDNLEEDGFCPFGEPMLTSIDFPKRRITELAVELILDEISHPSGQIKTLKLPCELKVRKTFGG